MTEEDPPLMPDNVIIPSFKPFAGLFENKAQREVIQEIIANPFQVYTQKEMAELLERTNPTLRYALTNLVEMGILIKVDSDSQRPKYQINNRSKSIMGLTFLNLAINDDRFNTDSMNRAIIKYSKREFPHAFNINVQNIVISGSNMVHIGEAGSSETPNITVYSREV